MSNVIYRLKGYTKGKQVFSTTRKKKLTLLSFCKAKFLSESIDKLYFKALYGHGDHNEGYYSSLKDFIQAYQAFTSESLINYLRR